MQQPTMFESRHVAADTHALRSYVPVPGYGVLPVNAHLIRAREPVLVDTGVAALRGEFMQALRRLIDPAALRWIWITHTDADHVGNLQAVLAEAPHARVVTNYLGMGKMGMLQLPVERAYLVNPGQSLHVGDRELFALRPPSYDAPETMALFDTRSRALLSADCFGALMSQPAEDARAVAAAELREGLFAWSAVDAPWLGALSVARLQRALAPLRDLAPETVLGSHLPPAPGMADTLFETLIAAREAEPFVGPDQSALERMMSLPQAA